VASNTVNKYHITLQRIKHRHTDITLFVLLFGTKITWIRPNCQRLCLYPNHFDTKRTHVIHLEHSDFLEVSIINSTSENWLQNVLRLIILLVYVSNSKLYVENGPRGNLPERGSLYVSILWPKPHPHPYRIRKLMSVSPANILCQCCELATVCMHFLPLSDVCQIRFIFIFTYSDGKPRVLYHSFSITGTNHYSWTLTDPQGGIILNKCYNTLGFPSKYESEYESNLTYVT